MKLMFSLLYLSACLYPQPALGTVDVIPVFESSTELPSEVQATHFAPIQKTSQKPQSKPELQKEEILNNHSIIQLLKIDLSEDLIISKIQKTKHNFDLSTDGIISLKQGGASDRLIRFMMDPTKPLEPKTATPPPPAPAVSAVSGPSVPTAPRITEVPAQPKTGDLVADKVPQEPGLYYLKDAELLKLDLRTLASAKVAGRLGNFATFGMKSVKTNAYLIGPGARTRFKETSPLFYFRLPEGFGIDELVLVTLFVKTDRRELEVAAKGGIVGGKQGLRMEVMKPFDSQELGPRLYKIATSILGRGEYLFYLIGSADAIKGIQGKGYDFGVE